MEATNQDVAQVIKVLAKQRAMTIPEIRAHLPPAKKQILESVLEQMRKTEMVEGRKVVKLSKKGRSSVKSVGAGNLKRSRTLLSKRRRYQKVSGGIIQTISKDSAKQ